MLLDVANIRVNCVNKTSTLFLCPPFMKMPCFFHVSEEDKLGLGFLVFKLIQVKMMLCGTEVQSVQYVAQYFTYILVH